MELRTVPLLMSQLDEGNERLKELQFIQAAIGGDAAAFEQLMIRYERRIISLAWRLLGNMDDAQDAAQEAFLRAYKYLPRFDISKSFEPWIVRMTVNVSRDLARKRSDRTLVTDSNDAGAATDPYKELHAAEQRNALYSALQQLPEKERAAVILRDLEGFSTSEVADILGSSPATVRVQISSARVKVRNLLKKMKRDSQ